MRLPSQYGALSNAVDLSKWHWEAPSLPSEREDRQRRQQEQLSFSGWSSASWPVGVKEWVKERLSPTAPADSTTVVASEARKPPRPAQEPVRGFYAIAAAFQNEVDSFCSLSQDTPMNTVISDFNHLCMKFQQYLHLGHFTKDEIQLLSSRLWVALDVKLAGSPQVGSLYLSLYSSIIAGISSCSIPELAIVDPQLRKTILLRMASLPASNDLYQLFQATMAAASSQEIDFVMDGILAILGNFFSSISSLEANEDGTELWRWFDTVASEADQLQLLIDNIGSSLQACGEVDHVKRMLDQAESTNKRIAAVLQLAEDAVVSHGPQVRRAPRPPGSLPPETRPTVRGSMATS